jgi:fatty-acyl-CoA synthase
VKKTDRKQTGRETILAQTTLLAHLERRLREAPDATAFTCAGRALSVAQLAQASDAAAAFLQANDIGAGDCVAVWLVNRLEWMALLFGAAKIGAVIAAVNTRYRSADLAHVLKTAHAKMLVMEPEFRGLDFPAILKGVAADEAPHLRRLAIFGASALEDARWPCVALPDFLSAKAAPVAAVGDAHAPLLLFTTSGTTKGPKLVAHSQTTLGRHARDIATALAIDPARDALTALLPFCGTFGMVNVLASFAAGAPVHVLETFDAAPALHLMRATRTTLGFGSDEMFRRMLEIAQEEKPLPHVRLIGFAAFQPGWRDLVAQAERRGLPLHGLYGSSEVQALFSIGRSDAPVDVRTEPGGMPVCREAKVRIRDLETGELASAGMSGEIEIWSPSKFLGYYKNEAATREATTVDGFFKTGDIGHLREDGSFVYETRAGDAMRLGGFLVGPGEIEDELKALDGVADAQVVAVDVNGQARCAAFVIPQAQTPAPAEGDLIAALRARLAPYKIPARIFFVPAFPVTESANGVKIQRAKLRADAQARML